MKCTKKCNFRGKILHFLYINILRQLTSKLSIKTQGLLFDLLICLTPLHEKCIDNVNSELLMKRGFIYRNRKTHLYLNHTSVLRQILPLCKFNYILETLI